MTLFPVMRPPGNFCVPAIRISLKASGRRGRRHRALLPIVITGSREPLQLAVLRGLQIALAHLRGRRCSHTVAHQRVACPGNRGEAAERPRDYGVVRRSPQGRLLDSRGRRVLPRPRRTWETAGIRGGAPREFRPLYTPVSGRIRRARARPFLILGILHQDFSLYADRLSGRERAEWDKVRGRFEDIAFEEPVDELLRLVAEARSQSPEGVKLDQLPAAGRSNSDPFAGRHGCSSSLHSVCPSGSCVASSRHVSE